MALKSAVANLLNGSQSSTSSENKFDTTRDRIRSQPDHTNSQLRCSQLVPDPNPPRTIKGFSSATHLGYRAFSVSQFDEIIKTERRTCKKYLMRLLFTLLVIVIINNQVTFYFFFLVFLQRCLSTNNSLFRRKLIFGLSRPFLSFHCFFFLCIEAATHKDAGNTTKDVVAVADVPQFRIRMYLTFEERPGR